MEIEYNNPHSKLTDYVMRMNNMNVAVSVTRAMSFPNPYSFTQKDATRLLNKKLSCVYFSNRNVVGNSAWSTQILHI